MPREALVGDKCQHQEVAVELVIAKVPVPVT